MIESGARSLKQQGNVDENKRIGLLTWLVVGEKINMVLTFSLEPTLAPGPHPGM